MEGVAFSYHPLLHEALLARRVEFDFVEIALDHYVDCARFPLLDSEESRLHEIAGALPCIWHGSVLSLGSVETLDDASPDPRLIEHIRGLIEKTGARSYCETIGFRRLGGRDLGHAQSLPYTRTSAQWVAERYEAARQALGCPLVLELAASAVAAPRSEWDAMTFLQEVAGRADPRFMLDVADLARFAAEASLDPMDMMSRLPGERIAALVISSDSEEDWSLLSKLSVEISVRSILIRRSKNLFPLDGIGRAVSRAKELLARSKGHARTRSERSAAAYAVVPGELAALQAYQREFIDCCLDASQERAVPAFAADKTAEWAALATRVSAWQAWQKRLEDIHLTRQIRQFLANDP
jgi:uncharacterized protein